MSTTVPRARLVLSLAMGIAAISFASILIRLAQRAGVPPLAIAAWRLIFASAVLLPYAAATHRSEIRDLSRREWGLLFASGVFLGLHFASWIGSFGYTSVASSVVLVSMGPMFVGLGSWLLLHERPGTQLIAGLATAALGSGAVSLGDLGRGHEQLLGDMLALTGAVMVAGYLMIGRQVRARRSVVTYIAVVCGVATLTLLAIVLVARQPLLGFSPAAYAWMLALALLPQLIGHSTLSWALRHMSATYVSIITLAEPMGAGLLAYLLLGETVTWPTALGGVLVLAGIFVAGRAELT